MKMLSCCRADATVKESTSPKICNMVKEVIKIIDNGFGPCMANFSNAVELFLSKGFKSELGADAQIKLVIAFVTNCLVATPKLLNAQMLQVLSVNLPMVSQNPLELKFNIATYIKLTGIIANVLLDEEFVKIDDGAKKSFVTSVITHCMKSCPGGNSLVYNNCMTAIMTFLNENVSIYTQTELRALSDFLKAAIGKIQNNYTELSSVSDLAVAIMGVLYQTNNLAMLEDSYSANDIANVLFIACHSNHSILIPGGENTIMLSAKFRADVVFAFAAIIHGYLSKNCRNYPNIEIDYFSSLCSVLHNITDNVLQLCFVNTETIDLPTDEVLQKAAQKLGNTCTEILDVINSFDGQNLTPKHKKNYRSSVDFVRSLNKIIAKLNQSLANNIEVIITAADNRIDSIDTVVDAKEYYSGNAPVSILEDI